MSAQPKLFGYEITFAECLCYKLAEIYIDNLNHIIKGDGITLGVLSNSKPINLFYAEVKESLNSALEAKELMDYMDTELNDSLLDKLKQSKIKQVHDLYTDFSVKVDLHHEITHLPPELRNKTVWEIVINLLKDSIDSMIPFMTKGVKSLEETMEVIKRFS